MISVPSVRLSVCNAFSPSLVSQIFWNYSLSGVKVRECPSLFLIFAKFGPGGPKNGHFLPFFLPFLQFFGLKNLFRERIFLFLNMMFFGIFRSDLQNIVEKGSKFGPPGPKNSHFWPFFGHFRSFSDFKNFLVNEIFWYFNMMFLGIFRSDLQKMGKKGQNSALQGSENGHFWPFFDHFRSFSDLIIFLVNEFFWIFNMIFLGIFWSDLQKIVKKGSKFGPLGAKKTAIFGHFCSFSELKIFLVNEFFCFFNMMFLGIFRSDLQKKFEKGSNFKGWKNDVIFQIPLKLASNLAPCFATKCSNHL